MSRADLLVEIGTEELPPKALKVLSERFAEELGNRLRDAQIALSEISAFATPRRLAVRVAQLATIQPAQTIERRGPAIAAAFKADGQPTPAALGFAKSCGVALDALARVKTEKGEWLSYRAELPGQPTRELLPVMIDAALAALPIPKRMRWGARSEEFVRPVHWVVVLHGNDVVPAEVLGISSGRETRGHRFMGTPRITLDSPAEYLTRLADEGRVLADFATRRARILAQVEAQAGALGCRAIFDDALLDEVTALVEWPTPIVGTFDAHYLEVPREALIATMQGNQKYFPLETADGRLSNRFVTISNIESAAPEFVRDGNERVIRPRLSDAAFFFDKDRRTPLAARTAQLADIVFERRLGSLGQKSERVMRLATDLATAFGADPAHAARAALLSRCDLVTEMVGEFPELQGTMGRYYARHDGEAPEVAAAIGEFYRPRFAGDALPETPAGRTLACADRLDTLVGIFAVGGAPTGDRDPYALRRAALGCLRLCIETGTPIDLAQALAYAAAGYPAEIAPQIEQVIDFIRERSRGYFLERGYAGDVIEAVLSTRPTIPNDIARRIAAVGEFMRLPQAATLAAANKRIANILKKTEDARDDVGTERLHEPAERALAAAVTDTAAASEADLARADYTAYLSHLAGLHDAINAFFDTVLVMAEDRALRDARLALLRRIHRMFLRVADIALVSS
ncbi:MAG: glycine--tRNA ligase subunit beta [Gammaproteobacteria bacterium]